MASLGTAALGETAISETPLVSDIVRVLVVDDDEELLQSLREYLIGAGVDTDAAVSLSEARRLLESHDYSLVMMDQRFQDTNGLQQRGSTFLVENEELIGDAQTILFTGFAKDISRLELDELSRRDTQIIKKGDGDVFKALERALGIHTPASQQVDASKVTQVIKPDPISSRSSSDGISGHIASDLWTTEDSLGYRNFAYAIYKFMTHPLTRAPLTISVQAPWGGGKTSLMRMIRGFIDPQAERQHATELTGLGELRLGDALQEVSEWAKGKFPAATITPATHQEAAADEAITKNLSIWFNAWKYESTNQVWAGLVDAIFQQLSVRLPVSERELFWLRLNARRVDVNSVRQRFVERIFSYFLKGLGAIVAWLSAFAGLSILVLGILLLLKFDLLAAILSASSVFTLLTGIGSALKYKKAKEDAEKEPAALTLGDYLSIPSYGKEIGFLHQAEADLKRVLASVPDAYKPLVIFVDDLDRCSPTKISQVVEAVNLFLAGDFPECFFVIGMDTEMVAAALQVSHKEMTKNLPPDLGIPLGWRFMDKFVQLPFLIPPSGDLTRKYINSLFSSTDPAELTESSLLKVTGIVNERANQMITARVTAAELASVADEQDLTAAEQDIVMKSLEAKLVERAIDEGIQSFTDKNDQLKALMLKEKVFDYFSGNPRELKRFMNSFRFNYFLWWAFKSQGLRVVSMEQLLRWSVLSLRWPEVVRWLRRSGGSDWEPKKASGEVSTPTRFRLVNRLRLIEEIGGAPTFADWQTRLGAKFNLTTENAGWISDDDLYHFFKKEHGLAAKNRLSSGNGMGLW